MGWFLGALFLAGLSVVVVFAVASYRNQTAADRSPAPNPPLRVTPPRAAPTPGPADGPGRLRWTKVVGVTRGNAQRIIGRAARRGGGDFSLRREADNPHDRNAVRVHLDGAPVGWLPRGVAAEVAPVMDGVGDGEGDGVGSVTLARAEVVGGGEGRNWGIRLQLRVDDRAVRAAVTRRFGALGENLRRLRKRRRLTQKALAEKSGVPAVEISGIENRWYERGHGMAPTDGTVRRLAEALEVERSDLCVAPDAAGNGPSESRGDGVAAGTAGVEDSSAGNRRE